MKRLVFCFCMVLLLALKSTAYAAYEEKLAGPTQGSQAPHVDILDGAEDTSSFAPVVEKSLPDAPVNTPASLPLGQQVQPIVSGVQQLGKGSGSRVNSRGNMPLRHAVILLIPRGWSGHVANDVTQKKVIWDKHENWVTLLGKICSENNVG